MLTPLAGNDGSTPSVSRRCDEPSKSSKTVSFVRYRNYKLTARKRMVTAHLFLIWCRGISYLHSKQMSVQTAQMGEKLVPSSL